jgi:hypothetical protein
VEGEDVQTYCREKVRSEAAALCVAATLQSLVVTPYTWPQVVILCNCKNNFAPQISPQVPENLKVLKQKLLFDTPE